MAGRMGGKRITVKNLDVIKVDKDRDMLDCQREQFPVQMVAM